MVTASRAISSPVRGCGTRLLMSAAVMRASSSRIRSTGRSARPAAHQATAATNSTATGRTRRSQWSTGATAASASSGEMSR